MGRQIEELLSDPAKEAPPDNLAVLRLAAHIKDNERSIRIINAYTFHELRNGIAMLTSKLQAGYSSQELLDSFSELNRSVEDLLALSAVRNDTWEKIDLAMVCAMVVDDYRKKYRDIHFLFEESVSPGARKGLPGLQRGGQSSGQRHKIRGRRHQRRHLGACGQRYIVCGEYGGGADPGADRRDVRLSKAHEQSQEGRATASA